MITFPNAKINLGLNIVGRRADGYHLLETLFYPISLTDTLEVHLLPKGSDDRLTVYGNDTLGNVKDNLVLRAVRVLRTLVDVPPLDIYLNKRIPAGAGMGGGSADASFMLTMLCRELSLPVDPICLKGLALELGADCPFFIDNVPSVGRGIGEELEPNPIDLSGYTLLLAKPNLHISTAKAFSGLGEIGQWELPLEEVIRLGVQYWRMYLKNDFEQSLFPLYPELGVLKAMLYEAGAVYASMTGSGSVVYGLFQPNTRLEMNKFKDLPNTQLWELEL